MTKLNNKGVSLVEVLIAILVVLVASLGAFSFYTYGMAGIGKEGRHRAAIERARQRLEQLMEAPINQIAGTDPADGATYWVTGSPGSWTRSTVATYDNVTVDDLATQQMETIVQRVDDVDVGIPPTLEVVELRVKVWFSPAPFDDDDEYNRVHIRTLRTPT